MTDDVLGAPQDDQNTTDEALGGNPDVEDITNDVTPEDFDFDAFVDGVRPGRRAVRVNMRADLVAELDQILIKADGLEDPNGEEAQALLARFEEIKKQIEASRRVFVVEARSEHRARELVKQMEKLGLPQPGKKADEDEIREWNEELAIRRLADSIIVPSNVSVEGLKKLRNVAESEVNKLYGALHDANTNPTKATDPNLSRRR